MSADSSSTECISLNRALVVGTLAVNGPTIALLCFPAYVAFRLAGDRSLIFFTVLVVGFLAAWTYWAIAAPRWRIWALERVESRDELLVQAVRTGILWPQGHFFERTELVTSAMRARRKALTPQVEPEAEGEA